MTPEQQRKMLECAAKACGYEIFDWYGERYTAHDGEKLIAFNPLTNPGDTAEMCAKLGIGTRWYLLNDCVVCGPSYSNVTAYFKDHDNSRMKSWMLAATMVGACIGGYQNDHDI